MTTIFLRLAMLAIPVLYRAPAFAKEQEAPDVETLFENVDTNKFNKEAFDLFETMEVRAREAWDSGYDLYWGGTVWCGMARCSAVSFTGSKSGAYKSSRAKLK